METPPPPSIREVTDFINGLTELEEDKLDALITNDRDAYARLLESLGGFVSVTCGNLNKLYEKALTLDLQIKYAEEAEVTHIANKKGSDIEIKHVGRDEVESIEVKCSVVREKKKYHTNWNFKANPALMEKYMEEKDPIKHIELESQAILELYRKMKAGRAIMVARTATKPLHQYEIDGLFMAIVVIKIARESTEWGANFGCDRCKYCLQYHRIRHLQNVCKVFMPAALLVNPNLAAKPTLECFSLAEWETIFTTIPAQKHCERYED
jgi:hypothetical protein